MPDPRFLMIPGAPTPVAPFSHAVESEGWCFITGQMRWALAKFVWTVFQCSGLTCPETHPLQQRNTFSFPIFTATGSPWLPNFRPETGQIPCTAMRI